MPPPSALLLSPPHLSYLHSSLSLTPPIRPDARAPTSFRPLRAETDLLPAAHGSARICFADGTEAVVGVRAEVERTVSGGGVAGDARKKNGVKREDEDGGVSGDDSWVEVAVEMVGQSQQQSQQQRSGGGDEEGGIVFLEQMLREGLLVDGTLTARLTLGRRWHWKLFVDILLLSPPYTYPLPLLSLTSHLALVNTRLPAPISSLADEEDPLFNDDWAAAQPLYPTPSQQRPPATVLAVTVGPNVFFDPSREEIAVADVVLSLTFAAAASSSPAPLSTTGKGPMRSTQAEQRHGGVKLLAIRMVEPPGRRMTTALGAAEAIEGPDEGGGGVWKKRAGGVRREVVRRVVDLVVSKGGVGEEVLAGLEGWV